MGFGKQALLFSLAAAPAAVGVWLWRRKAGREAEFPNARPSRLARDLRRCALWRFDTRSPVLPAGKILRLEVTAPAIVRWTDDDWQTSHDVWTVPVDGAYAADLDTTDLRPGSRVRFTFYWPEARRWEGEDFEARIEERALYGGALSD